MNKNIKCFCSKGGIYICLFLLIIVFFSYKLCKIYHSNSGPLQRQCGSIIIRSDPKNIICFRSEGGKAKKKKEREKKLKKKRTKTENVFASPAKRDTLSSRLELFSLWPFFFSTASRHHPLEPLSGGIILS